MRKELSKSRSEASGYRKKIARLEEQLKAAKADKYGRRKSKDDKLRQLVVKKGHSLKAL